MIEKVEAVKALLRAVFPRSVRMYLYGVSVAVTVALVSVEVLPVGAVALVGPPLLALLNLSPKDVEQ